ncbi:MAG: hypothetical protein V2A76_10210 [Planctomycetota bacterium]
MGINHQMLRWGALALLGFLAFAHGFQEEGRGKQAVLEDRDRQREQILAIAEQYVTHEWTASEKNVFHGKTPNGIPVATPDDSFDEDGWKADGSTNVGIPYAWGGFSSSEQFDEGVAEGMYAGNVPESTGVPGTGLAVGVDCSGFVARCWDLPVKQSDEIPLQGILEVDYDFEITWEENGDDKTVSERKMHLSLLEFGGPVPVRR